MVVLSKRIVLKISFLLTFLLLFQLMLNAQSPSSLLGSWDFTYEVEDLQMQLKGHLTITSDGNSFSGIIQFNDVDNSSPIYAMNDLSFNRNTLEFTITEGGFAPMQGKLTLRSKRLEGTLTLSIPWMDDYKGSGKFLAIPQPEGVIIDHAKVLTSLDQESLQLGKKLYNQVCAACHGADGISSLAAARSFRKDQLKYGSDPYSMWKTIVNGAGQMGAQRWLSPKDAYAIIQYIREDIIKVNNADSYYEITESYLEGLPKPIKSQEELSKQIKKEALSGSQQFGQLYFVGHLGEYGKALYSQLKDRANSAFTIGLGEDIFISYNVQRMSTAAVWKGSLDLSKTKYQLYRGEGEPEISGMELPGYDLMHWSFKDRYHQLNNLVSNRTPFPSKWLHYNGHYQQGTNSILSYAILGREILEMPSGALLNNKPVVSHTFTIEPGDSWRKIVLGGLKATEDERIETAVFRLNNLTPSEKLPEDSWVNPEKSVMVAINGEQFFAAGVQGTTGGMKWMLEEEGQLLALFVPPSDTKLKIRIHRYSGMGAGELEDFASYLAGQIGDSVPDLNEFIKGGPSLWPDKIILSGKLNVGIPHYDPINYEKDDRTDPENLVKIPENYPYVVDRIPLPFDNPWGSWIRPSGLDFFPDGRLVISTYAGDVWIAEGIDQDLKSVSWQRIATGLYDPFGVKVVNEEIYVTCRDRIVHLKDLNDDGETDFYESFFADSDVSSVPVQAFNYSLQTDKEGNFIYSKGGQYTNDDEPGHVIRVTPDGKHQQSMAIGFRAPNGVTIGPNDQVYVSDNQGNWGPANKINLIKEGEFYGYLPTIRSHDTQPGKVEYTMKAPLAAANYPDDILPDTFEEPIIWLPQEFDNSPGNGAWTPKDWGPLGDRLLHTSFGKGWVYQVLMQEIDGITQAAVSALPFQLEAGVQRARVNPVDGQYYVAGITGWDDSFATKYGSLDRIRFIDGHDESLFLKGFKVRKEGIELSFNNKLNEDIAKKLENYKIHQWNYLWSEEYGSANWSIKNPGQEGQDVVEVIGVELLDDAKKLLLKIAPEDLVPVDQMRIVMTLESDNGQPYKDTMYLTIHKIPSEEESSNGSLWWIAFVLLIILLTAIIWKKNNSAKSLK